MNKTIYKRFAHVIVEIGINLQPGQEVLLTISTRQRAFAKYITEACYKKGAARVNINWLDEDIDYLKYKYEDEASLSKVRDFEVSKARHMSKVIPCRIWVDDDNPAAFDGLDINKIIRVGRSRRRVLKKYRDITDGYEQWCIVAVPSPAWANVVFPNMTKKDAMKHLWEAIIKTTRLESSNPVLEWNNHVKNLSSKASILNKLHLDYLKYRSSNGTDLKIKLHKMHLWQSASEANKKGITFVANMPTEEVFTMPDRYGVDGVVKSTKPLSYNGSLIEDFTIWFEAGKAVKWEARKGYDTLTGIIESDEASHRLGEVALVPYDSPINESKILFYNTLFDENACCHLAFGHAFKDNLVGYETMSEEEFKKIDFNDSIVHVDFMIGSEDLEIKGYDSNDKEYIIFKNGKWAI